MRNNLDINGGHDTSRSRESRADSRRAAADERARREARKYNYEYRNTAVRDGNYAARLEAGFKILQGE